MHRPAERSWLKCLTCTADLDVLRRLPSAQAKPKKAVARKPFANDESIEQAYTIVWPILFYVYNMPYNIV